MDNGDSLACPYPGCLRYIDHNGNHEFPWGDSIPWPPEADFNDEDKKGVCVMDPDATLQKIRELIGDGDSADVLLIEAFEALDEWLCKGGSLPRDWRDGVKR